MTGELSHTDRTLDEQPRRPVRRGRRFSLRFFLGMLTVAALAGSHVWSSWKLRNAQQELARLRRELGYLVIEDPEQVHVVAAEAYEDLTWRWRIYRPANRQIHLHMGTTQDRQETIPSGGSWSPLNNGDEEFSLVATVRPRLNGGWQLRVTIPNGHERTTVLSPEMSKVLDQAAGFSWSEAGASETVTWDGNEPLVLLRLTPRLRSANNRSTQKGDQSLVIWFTEAEES